LVVLARNRCLPTRLTESVEQDRGENPDHEKPGENQERVQERALVAEL
jgi:hypothetical protein